MDEIDFKVKITWYAPGQEGGSRIMATFGIDLGIIDLYLSKCKVVVKKDGDIYVAPPAEQHTDRLTGQKKFQNYWGFGPRTSEAFQDQCKEAIIEYCKMKAIVHPWTPGVAW